MEKEDVLNALRNVYDPEYPISVVDLGIVEKEDVQLKGDSIRLQFKPTTPHCPMGGVIGVIIKYALESRFKVPVDVKVKAGTHAQEEMLNDMLSRREKYEEVLERMKMSGMLEKCLVSEAKSEA